MVKHSVFLELEFIMLLVISVGLPFLIYATTFRKRKASKLLVISFGTILTIISGVDVYLLQILSKNVLITASTLDNEIFSSEISAALYLFPAVYAGIGITLMTDVVTYHLTITDE